MALWNKLTYPRRLFLWLCAYSLTMMACVVGFQYHRERDFRIRQLNDRLQAINRDILIHLDNGEESSLATDHFSYRPDNLRISVIDSAGRVVCDNSTPSLPESNHLSRDEIASAIATGSGYTVRRYSQSTDMAYFYSATRGDNGLIVRTAVPYSASLGELLKPDSGFIWTMAGITVAMCAIGFLATSRLGSNIRRLNRFAAKAEQGERIYDFPPFPKDELGSISSHIVRLYASLQKAVADREQEHKAALREQKEKELVKKRLTNNINHELKTPVAAIQACVELLLSHDDMSAEKQKEFLKRCLANTERLKQLLDDVGLISRMDEAPASIPKEQIDIAEIIADVAAECAPMAAASGIAIADHIGANVSLPIEGNRQLMASVFRNLIVNAVAYSGGTAITIDLMSADPSEMVIRVADNGCGVGKDHLQHLFERFYRVDKGRSRSSGGTGLGLAIVKNAVMLHGGSVSVDLRKEGGLEFTLTLPRN